MHIKLKKNTLLLALVLLLASNEALYAAMPSKEAALIEAARKNDVTCIEQLIKNGDQRQPSNG